MRKEAFIKNSIRPGGSLVGGALTNNGQELPDISCQIPIHDLPVEHVLGRECQTRGCLPQSLQTGRRDLEKHLSSTHHLQLKIGSPNLLQDGCRCGGKPGRKP